MKAIIVEQFGEPSVMRLAEIADPRVGDSEILLRVMAVGVNPVDAYIRSGTYGTRSLPYTPGLDAGGIVEAVGQDVRGFAPGDRVYAAGTKTGAYAELALCEVAQIHHLPDNISFEQGSALGVPYATAWCALMLRAKARQGETVLVHGATGGVGLAAVQIALDCGLNVVATGGTPKGRQLLKQQDAHYVFDHGAPDSRHEILAVNCGRGPNVILEMAAHHNLAADLQMIARHGRIVVIGSRGEININPRDIMSREAHITGITLFNVTPEETALAHAYIAKGLTNGALKPVIRDCIPLGNASAAHETVMQSGAGGKLVLVP